MFAPRFFPHASRAAIGLLLLLVGAFVAVGCTVPGAGRLEGPPEDLPAVLDYVTADALTTTLLDADPAAKRWARFETALGAGDANLALAPHWERFLGAEATPTAAAAWAGDVTGTARYTIDRASTSADDASLLWFAGVRSRAKLEDWLREHGWKRAKGDLGGELGAGFDVWIATEDVDGAEAGALGVSSKALLGARNRPALRELVAAADRYAFPDRKALADYAVDAHAASPVAVLFRTDLLRTQVRRLVEEDPAMLELVRWTTVSKLLLAARDGWFGLAPPIDASRDSVRIIGKVDWVADLAPDLRLKPADRALLAEFVPDASIAVALHDPGQVLEDAINGITRGGNQFATEGDVKDAGKRVDLLELLEDLDGDAAIAHDARRGTYLATIRTDAGEIEARVREALDLAELPARVDAVDGGVGILVNPNGGNIAPYSVTGSRDLTNPEGALATAFAPAGKPPRPPIAWLWQGGTQCDGPTAGWVTYDGVERFTFSLDVAASPSSEESRAPCGRASAFDGLRRVVAGDRWQRLTRARPALEPEATAPTPRR
ncbi:MAG: hypothetical protein JWM86_1840 [Thermoleophilia bacterium]|nr:hypothetical protein [Thermoleophilia bacterium]